MPMKRERTAFLMRALVVIVHTCMVVFVTSSPSNVTDQLALLAFKSSINFDPNNMLSNWTKETSFCDWAGVTCSSRRQRVTVLHLRDMGLQGTISPHLGNLSFLQLLNLRNNSFHGHLPHEITNLSRLKRFTVAQNNLEGEIPIGLHQCRMLQFVSLALNNFTGSIPKELSSLPLLRELYLGQNKFTGTIPPSFGNTSTLEYFTLESNNIHGNIPIELALLPNLVLISFQGDNLSGSIPPEIFNKSSMTGIYLSYNAFSGNLPTTTGLWLPNLQVLELHSNQLSGNIPSYLSNCSQLTSLYLANNSFTGPIPKSFGNLKSLQMLDASICQVTGNIPGEIGNLRNLILLGLFGNNLEGNIPSSIRGLERMQILYLSGNNFYGPIPNEICLLKNLGELYLGINKLSGAIPSCIENLSRLQVMSITSNKLEGIPLGLWNLGNLRLLDLSFNSIGGTLDSSIRTSKVMQIMDLSSNLISGNIPIILGSFQSIANLNLSRNSFSGFIPNSLGNLVTLDFLDLSHNNMSGSIPKSLETLSHLQYLDLSYNKLSGEVPSEGPFRNFTAQSFKENQALCGDPILQLPPCTSPSSHKSRSKVFLLQYILPPIALMVIIASVLYIVKRLRGNNVQSQHLDDLPVTMEHISYLELLHATNNFSEANLLGVGSYGSVYKCILSNGAIVAVKVLNMQMEGALRSFDAECNVLRTTRHRNLARVITICANLDFRALVLQYMSNGNLEKWLYSHNYCLNLVQRVSVMIDVALALEYLHHDQLEPVIHCDLKPSNILLDEDMVGHVADFGIARILAENKTEMQTKTLGTLGYIAPEYGFEGRVSISGDVYSYGILLLETFTRKKPTDDMFIGEVSLRQWVSTSLPHKVLEVVDGSLLMAENGGDMLVTPENLVAILELGLKCSRESTAERGDIREVVGKLSDIRKKLLIGIRSV